MQNLYDLLGVSPDDDAESLKTAFRKAAKASHPDHHADDPQAAARFRRISEAYEILRDPEQRAAYDRLLESERRPLRHKPHHKPKRSWSGLRRHAVRDVVAGVLMAAVLAAGYEWFAGNLETADNGAAGIVARESGQAAGDDRRVPAAQMPIALPKAPTTAVGSVATGRDRPETISGKPVSEPAGQTVAVATRGSESDDQTGAAGRPERTLMPQMPVAIPTPAAASDHDRPETADGEPASNPAGQTVAAVTRDSESEGPASGGVPRRTEGEPTAEHGAPSHDAPFSSPAEKYDSIPAAGDKRESPGPAGANTSGAKPPEKRTPLPAAAKRHAPSREPLEHATLENRNAPAPDDTRNVLYGVGF